MKKFKKFTVLATTVLIVICSSGSTYASAESNFNCDTEYVPQENLYYEDTIPLLKGTYDEKNPALSEMAYKYGYGTDTFKFVNFTAVDYISEEEVADFINIYVRNKLSSEEVTHNLVNCWNTVGSGVCYGLSALSVLVHNGYIKPSDIQSNAENLYDISPDSETVKLILEYAVSQNYHEVELANYKYCSLKTNEDYVDELLEYGSESIKTGKYFLIAYNGVRDDNVFGHAVTGIGMAEGNWTFNDIKYDKCILTYDSNCKNKDTGAAGGFTESLCIYVNSETKQFCIPGYGFTTENGSTISYITDSANRLNYHGIINGVDDIGENISDSVKMYFFGNRTNGIEVTAKTDDGAAFDVNERIESYFQGMWGNRFYLFNSNEYHIVQNKGVEYSVEHNGDNRYSTGINGSTWGQYYTTRYSADSNYNYIIDIDPQKVSVTNTKAAPGYEDKEMSVMCSLSYPDKYYYYFMGTAAENETISIEEYENGVLMSSSDGTLKGTMLIKSRNKDVTLINDDKTKSNIELPMYISGNAYVTIDDNKNAVIYLDEDKDGVYDTPLEQGDVNGDGNINIDDAGEALKYYAECAAGIAAGQIGLNRTYPLSIYTADLNGDKKIDISDATEILSKYARRAAGL